MSRAQTAELPAVKQLLELLDRFIDGEFPTESLLFELDRLPGREQLAGAPLSWISGFHGIVEYYDPGAFTAKTRWERFKKGWQATNGNARYSREEVLREAVELRALLRGDYPYWRRVIRWWNPFR